MKSNTKATAKGVGGTERIEIPQYTLEDFVEGQKPYEWLYSYHADKFLMEQLFVRTKLLAEELKVPNFPNMFKKFCAGQQKPGEEPARIENYTNFSGQDTPLKCGAWTATDTGITGPDRFGTGEIEVCPHPIYPSKILTNIDTGLEKLELRYRRGNGPWRSHIFQKSTVANAQSIVKLSDYGIAVNTENARALVRFLGEVENKNLDEIPTANSVGRLGWIDGHGFSPYIPDLEFDGEDEYADRFKAVSEHGEYKKWLEAVRSIRKTESVPARIVLAASFASALVKPTGSLPFLLHLWGQGGSGKTVCVMVAASVWANPEMGRFIKSFNSTSVGKELGATFLNSLPLMLDELQIASTGRDRFRQMIYEFAEGVGRERGRKEGGLKKTGTWRNCMISTGEEPITDDRMTEGARYRTIEIDCGNYRFFESGNIVGDAKKVAGFFQKHYGFAGKIFVTELQKDMSVATQLQELHAKEILQLVDVDPKQALSAALIIAADELAELWIFQDGIGLTAEEIVPYLTNKSETDQNKKALEYLYDQLTVNSIHFDPETAIMSKTEIWGKVADYGGRKYLAIIKSKLSMILSEIDANTDKFLKAAKQSGLLRVSANGKTTVPTRFPAEPGKDAKQNVARCVWILINTEDPVD